MSSLYEWMFSQDSLIVNYKGLEIVIQPGQHVHVRSKRLQSWLTDGRVQSIYKTGVYVSYGHSMYFSGFTRGNTKFVALKDITSDLRFPSPKALKAISREDVCVLDEAPESSVGGNLPS